MKRLFLALLLMVMAFGASTVKAQMMGPIPVDDQVRIGKLDCGLTYYIRHNDYPEHRVDFFIAQRVGSIQEEENQRGLAHFLEHMAFNGSEHFNGEGKGIIDYTRSLGVAFGQNMNALTSISETIYLITEVPSTRQSAIDSCLLILKDWSGGLLLTDEEIDKERGVIHEEWRLRSSAKQRMLERQLETLYPGSKYGRRMPIGLMEIVDNFPYQDLRDYYHKWYRPDNQALIVVGDVDVDHIEAQIKELFKDCVLDPNAAQVVDEPVPDNLEPIIVIDKDKEQQSNDVTIMFKHEATPNEQKGDMIYLFKSFTTAMMSIMLNSRLNEAALEPDCPYLSAGASDGPYLLSKNAEAFTLSVSPKEGQTEAAVQAVVTEAVRAAEHGFTDTEYERAKENLMSILENAYNERNKISNTAFALEYCSNYLNNEPIPSIEQRYQLMQALVPQIPVELINMVIPKLINTTGENLVVMNFNQEKDDAVYPTPEGLKTAIDAGLNAQVEAFVDSVKQESLISKMPKKGKITKETYNSKFDYKELELSNGARAILKKTDFKKNEILMHAEARGGTSLYGKEDWVNIEKLDFFLLDCGRGNFTRTELEKATAGKQVDVYFAMSPYNDFVSGNSTVKDLETMFQLTYLTFTDINIDEKSFNQDKNFLEDIYKNHDMDHESIFMDSVIYTINNHDWRSKPYNVENLKKINLDRMMEIVKERTANAANYTFIFVGNFDEALIRQYIEQYIASLPGKKGSPSNWVNVTTRPEGETINHFSRKMETPKASAEIIWYDTKTPYSVENDIKAEMLGQVLSKIYLQKIREDAGAAYSASAGGGARLYGDRCITTISASCPVKPEFVDVALKIINEEMVTACSTIDATTLQEIKELMIKEHNTELKENSYWMSIISAYIDPGIDYHTGYDQMINAQTPESIAAFARQILAAGNKVEVVMTPEE